MHWNTIAAWAFGFFTPMVVVGGIATLISSFVLFFGLPDKFKFDEFDMWSGGGLFVALSILAAVVATQYWK